MSKLALGSGDDHPEAAKKHLSDAEALVNASRFDGAAYFAGYVVESSLKTLIIFERGASTAGVGWRGKGGHNLQILASTVNTLTALAGAKAAKYVGTALQGLSTATITSWKEMRYRAPSISKALATTWLQEARSVYRETVGQMMLDGII